MTTPGRITAHMVEARTALEESFRIGSVGHSQADSRYNESNSHSLRSIACSLIEIAKALQEMRIASGPEGRSPDAT